MKVRAFSGRSGKTRRAPTTNPIVTHWKAWLVMQKGVMLLALGLAYGVAWLVGLAVPLVVVGTLSFGAGWARDAGLFEASHEVQPQAARRRPATAQE